MRIDREAFLLAAWTLAAGCERADTMEEVTQVTPREAPRTAVPLVPPAPAVAVRVPAPIEQVMPAPTPRSVRPISAKRWFLGLSAQQQSGVTAVCDARDADPCAAVFGRVPRAPRDDDAPTDVAAVPTPASETFLAGLSVPQRKRVTQYCEERNGRRGMPSPTCETPLVVAFDDQPIELRASTGEFAFVPGQPMASHWPTAATPWIARDLDGDGQITTGAELFGSSTAIAGGTARNGFEALAALDANRDGTIDASDPAFATLLLWSDRNGDRRSTPDELGPLSAVVTSIPLAHTLDLRCVEGDCEGERGTLRWRDGSNAVRTGAVVDVYLRRR